MVSKKRVFFAKAQKKIKQKRKDQYVNIQAKQPLKKIKNDFLEKEQNNFINLYLNSEKFLQLLSVYNFYIKFVSKLHKCRNYSPYITTINLKKFSVFRVNQFSKQNLKTSNKDISQKLKTLLVSSFFSITTTWNIGNEILTLFLLTSNVQQFFLNTLGINHPEFKTMSSGRCLRIYFGEKISKSLKKSFRLNKALIEYYFDESTISKEAVPFTHTYIKPFNKKALIFFNQLQTNSEYNYTVLGFSKYYKTIYKTSRRIKKRIKKKLVSENLSYRPYKEINFV